LRGNSRVASTQKNGSEKMEDMEWNSIVLDVQEYLNADNDLSDSLSQVVQLHIQVGNEDESERTSAVKALKGLLSGRNGSPFRKGQKSSIPTAVRINVDRICGVVEEAAEGFYNHDPVIGAIMFKHVKSGGGVFDDAADYAKSVGKRTRNALNGRFKAKSWDGLLESLLPSDSEEEEEL
tara:strand:- start:1021 stop:1557 length:537 start_codon:yes stop_codon:yes gene_type:complete